MNTIKFSILIPAYKGKFLKEAIESIVNQTYNNWELIIVDDCSPEDLKQIANLYINEKIFYYRNEKNCGAVNVVDNWNKCLDYATGDYVICMGDDDVLLPGCLREYAFLIETYPQSKLFHVRTEQIDEEGNTIVVLEPREPYETTLSFIYYRWSGRRQYIGDFCYERKSLLNHGGFYKLPMAWASDDISAILQSESGSGVVNSNKVLFKYRVNSHSITGSGDGMIKLQAICLEKEWYKFFLHGCKPLENSLDLTYYNGLLNLYDVFFTKKMLAIISSDISNNLFRFFYWLFHSKQFDLCAKHIVYSLLSAIIDKAKRHHKGRVRSSV